MTTTRHSDILLDSTLVMDALYPIRPKAELIPRIRSAGVDVIHTTVGIHEDFRGAMEWIQTWLAFADAQSADLVITRSAEEIESAHASGRIAVLLGFQNASPIEDDIALLRLFKEMGVRIIQPTYNERNMLGDGCTERQNAGLSDFGVEFVREMNRLRLAIDLSHVGERTAFDAVEASAGPVIVSHANARALCEVPRNLSDSLARAVADTGGVIGVTTFPGFVNSKPGAEQTIDDMLDHVDYFVRLLGPTHVGIGSDLNDGKTEADYRTPDGRLGMGRHPYKPGAYPPWPWIYPMRSIEGFRDIAARLVARGYADEDVRAILGGNFLRVLGEIWGG